MRVIVHVRTLHLCLCNTKHTYAVCQRLPSFPNPGQVACLPPLGNLEIVGSVRLLTEVTFDLGRLPFLPMLNVRNKQPLYT